MTGVAVVWDRVSFYNSTNLPPNHSSQPPSNCLLIAQKNQENAFYMWTIGICLFVFVKWSLDFCWWIFPRETGQIIWCKTEPLYNQLIDIKLNLNFQLSRKLISALLSTSKCYCFNFIQLWHKFSVVEQAEICLIEYEEEKQAVAATTVEVPANMMMIALSMMLAMSLMMFRVMVMSMIPMYC